MKILITGAAGNLGGLLANHLLQESDHFLNLMVHQKPLTEVLKASQRTREYACDLAVAETLVEVCRQSEVVVHFAGKLFAPGPERFLPVTNTLYTRNLINASVSAGIKKFILISFPHVEGPTSAADPCTDRQDRQAVSVHAKTRLAAERYLFEQGQKSSICPVSLRPGMIYGKELLMLAFAKRLAHRHLLAVWREPQPIHLLSLADFLLCCRAAIENPAAKGIYPLGDDAPTTLQRMLDVCCQRWEYKRPRRLPLWTIYSAAWLCERLARIFCMPAPLTVDFIRIGRVPYFCDTKRMKADLLPRLIYPSLEAGKECL